MAALQLFALCAGAFQVLVAARILKPGMGPLRIVWALLLLANGLAAFQAGLGATAAGQWRGFVVAVGVTGPLLLACGVLMTRFPRHELGDRFGWCVLAAGAAWAALIVVVGAARDDLIPQPQFDWLHTLPTYVGLAIGGTASAWALRQAKPERTTEAALLAFALVPTLSGQFVACIDSIRTYVSEDAVASIPLSRLIGWVFVGVGTAASLAFVAWPARRSAGWRRALLLALVAAAMAQFAYAQPIRGPGVQFTTFIAATAAFYVVRPLALGLAYAPSGTRWAVYDAACLGAALVVGKLLSVAWLGTPPLELRAADAAGLGIGLFLLVPLVALPRYMLGVSVRAQDRPSADELLARFLLDASRRDPLGFVDKAAIEAATGITENNLAGAVRRLERRADPTAPAGTFVAEQRVGVRGRKQYRLTPLGVERLGRRDGRAPRRTDVAAEAGDAAHRGTPPT